LSGIHRQMQLPRKMGTGKRLLKFKRTQRHQWGGGAVG
jgi:hypothetical protein